MLWRSFFTEEDARRFALRNTCSKPFYGKLLGRSASLLKSTPLQMFPKVAGKFPKILEQLTKIQIYSIKFLCRWRDFQMVVLLL